MFKRLCFIYTETTGLHQTSNNVSKKELYKFARMVSLNYEIGYMVDNKFVLENKIRMISKPRCMFIPKETEQFHGITMEIANKEGIYPNEMIMKLKEDLKDVDIIISHSVDFHFKTILAEAVRYNINLDLSKYMVIDTISFFHNYGFIKLKDLATNLKIKDIGSTNENNTELIRKVFIKLYKKYEKSLTPQVEETD